MASFSGTDRFEIRRRIGAGAMGIVYEAFDRERGMPVALKTMRSPTPESLAGLKQELRALADIAHPNLVALHELHAADDVWFFTMELLDGVDLLTYVGGDQHRLRACIAQLAQAISALHEGDRRHRDIKPSNVLVTSDARVVLLDFGAIAVGAGDRASVGTPAYAAPEQARGEASPASDWYAFGVVLYQLLTGALPFSGSGRAMLYDKARYAAQPVRARNPEAPADLAALCDALLRREPTDRPSADEVLARLKIATRRRWPRATERDALLVGRTVETETLRGAFAEAERGRGKVVYVRGASGMGKTTLVTSFLRELERNSDAIVLASRCYPQESVPYKAVDSLVDMLARFLGTLSAADADAVLPRDILLLAHVFPVLHGVEAVVRARRRRGPAPEPHELRRRAFAALRELIARVAELRPLVLFIDDVQWGDVDSAPILDGLMAAPDTPAVLLVLAYRAEDEQHAPLLRALRHRRERLGEVAHPIELTIEALPEADARALAASLLPDDARSAAIAAESQGVPFLIQELALMVHSGVASIGHAVASRLEALPPDERAVLGLIAQAAKPVSRTALEIASDLAPTKLESATGRLTAARLIRLITDGDTKFECYHDRVREVVTGALTDQHRREYHARLADALATMPIVDHEALVVHCEGAGERTRAADHALAAADLATRALAFERAAELYRTALRLAEECRQIGDETAAVWYERLGDGPAARSTANRARPLAVGELAVPAREVWARLGEALANAGHGEAAADAYLAAAQGGQPAESLELRRRAASQLLRTGRVDEGLVVLGEVLDHFGERLPRTPRRALASLVWNRAKLRLKRRRRQARDAIHIPPYELLRLDVMWTAATDLGMVDLIVGADFATRQLLVALQLGEPVRAARALTTEAMFLAAQGQRATKRTEAVLAHAAALLEGVSDPELPAWVLSARGMMAYMAGQFRASHDYNVAAVRVLREECTGVLWQVGGVEIQVVWAQFYRGRLRDFSARVDAGVELARVRGNRFDAANFSTGLPALAWAVADRTAQGRIEVAHAMAAWTPRGFHLQHYYALLALASFDLYDGRPRDALARVEETWPALRRSHLLVCQSVAIEAHHLRARAAIGAGNDAAIGGALRAIGTYRGHGWAEAMVALIRAGMCTDVDAAVSALTIAEAACLRAELGAYAAAARRRRGELLADAVLIAEADLALSTESVRAPDRFAQMLVPIRAEI